jgi:AAHS family 4-hydroxybenzoate transporter-like MFS transporter
MQTINVQDVLDSRGVTRSGLLILVVCTLVMFVDGFDIFMVGAIAPAIAADLGESPSQMGFLFLCQQIGIAFGAVIMGPVSDRYGRKNVLTFCTGLFSVLMMGAALSQNLVELALMRGLSGIFLAGVFPVATTVISEFSPKRLRSRCVSILLAGYVAGSAGGGAVAAYLVGDYGWRVSFWIGALVPLLCVPLILAFIPESLQFRARRNSGDPSIGVDLRRFAPDLEIAPDVQFRTEEKAAREQPARIMDVFASNRLVPTFALWGAFLLAMGNGALISSWMPTYFNVISDVSIESFGRLLMFGSAAAVVATITVGILMDRFSPIKVLVVGYGLDALALATMGFAEFGSRPFVASFFVMKFCTYAGTVGLMVLASNYYPPAIKTTGFGWSVAAGRLGSIALPSLGGVALSYRLSIEQVSLMMALPAFCVVLLVTLFAYLSRAAASPASARAA